MTIFLLRCLPVSLLLFCCQESSFAACVDSIDLEIHSVECYGLRNGFIKVSAVYGGEKPFYYSIDGQSFSTNSAFDRLWPGAYTVYVRDASGCVKQWQAVVPEPEELEVYLFSDKDTVAEGETVNLQAVVTPPGIALQAIEWRPPDLFQVQDSLNQTVRLAETTNFAIEVRTPDGCLARDQITVAVDKTNLYFPNVIRPGSNQDAYFTLFAGEGISRIVSMLIYSRGGSVVFERDNFPPNDPLKGWNGRWGSKPVQPGVYLWVAEIEYLSGKRRQYQGNVTVVK